MQLILLNLQLLLSFLQLMDTLPTFTQLLHEISDLILEVKSKYHVEGMDSNAKEMHAILEVLFL